jgi:hypothetical protein
MHILQLYGGHAGVGRQVVEVQLQRVGAGVLDFPGIIDPAAGGNSVQAADHRHAHCPLHLAQVLQVGIRADTVLADLGDIGDGFWVGVSAAR